MLNNSRIIIQRNFYLNFKTFARLNSKTFDKIVPKLGKVPAKEPIIPLFSDVFISFIYHRLKKVLLLEKTLLIK